MTILPILGILIGLSISGFLIYDGIKSVVKHNYCMVLDEDWSDGFNTNVWPKEVEVGGFGYVWDWTESDMGWMLNLDTAMASSRCRLPTTRTAAARTAPAGASRR